MRLFIAINFEERVKKELLQIQNGLRELCPRGNYTRYDNLHLTLVFLGETRDERVPCVLSVMEGVTAPAFSLKFTTLGRFRRGGDIWWLGIEKNPALELLHAELSGGLRGAGFAAEDRKFTPHLTLAREVRTEPGLDVGSLLSADAEIQTDVEKISLMKSERIRDVLTYTPVYETSLNGIGEIF